MGGWFYFECVCVGDVKKGGKLVRVGKYIFVVVLEVLGYVVCLMVGGVECWWFWCVWEDCFCDIIYLRGFWLFFL